MSHLSSHVTGADLDRVRRGAASAEETAAVGRHVRECAECEALAAQRLAIGDSVRAFEAAFAIEGDEAEVREMPPRRRVVALGAGAAAAAVAALFFLIPRPPGSRPAPQPVVRAVPPPAVVPRAPQPRPEWDALLAETRTTGRLPFPGDIRELATPDTFRGKAGEEAMNAMWPVATAIDDERPELRWRAVEGARYVVTVTSRGTVLARSDALAMPRWRVPVALRRGALIRWQVRVERGGTASILPAPPAPPAIFRVIPAEEHEQIARAKAERPGDHLLIGLLHARAGMVEEARRELRASRDPLAPRLLEQLP
jgi:hypothetical protein